MQSITQILDSISDIAKDQPVIFLVIVIIVSLVLTVLLLYFLEAIKNRVVIKKIKQNFNQSQYRTLSLPWHSAKLVIEASRKFMIIWILMLVTLLTLRVYYPDTYTQQELLITQFYVVIFIITLIWFLINSADKIINARAKSIATTSIFLFLVKFSIGAFGIVYLLSYLGQDVSAIIAAFGIAGLAVALALQDTLSNFFAGLYIIASRQYRVGNYLKLDSGEEGYVTDINWRTTTLRAMQNNYTIVPNSRVASAIIINYDLPTPPLSVSILVGVSYDSDLDYVEKVTMEVATDMMKNDVDGVPEYEPKIRFHTFGDFAISFNVILRANKFESQYRLKSEFIKRLHKRYKQEGINIPFPIRTIQKMDQQE